MVGIKKKNALVLNRGVGESTKKENTPIQTFANMVNPPTSDRDGAVGLANSILDSI